MSTRTVCPKCVIASLIDQLAPDDPDARKRMAVHLVAFCDESLRTLMHMDFALCQAHQPPPEQEIEKLQAVMEAMTHSGLLKKR